MTPAALTLPRLDEALARFITTNYHQRRHPELKTSPHQAWLADGRLPRMPADLEALDLRLVWVAKPRMVQRDGIHFQGLRYLSPTLAAYVREPSPSAMTPATSPRSASSTRAGSYARQSVPTTPPRPSACPTSRPPAAPTGAGCANRSTNASPWSPTTCPPTGR